MRLALLTHAKPLKQDLGHWSLVLDSKQNVLIYFNLVKKKHSKSTIDFWFSAKKNEQREYPITLSHYVEWGNTTQTLASVYLSALVEGEEVTFADYCKHMDSMLATKMHTMLNIIDSHGHVSVNPAGGYSPLDDFYEILEEKNADKINAIKYLNGDESFVDKEPIKIGGRVLVIENDTTISGALMVLLKHYRVNDSYFFLNDFEIRTHGYSKESYFELFSNAISQGLEMIFIETTMLKLKQFQGMKQIIEAVMKMHFNKSLMVHILKNGEFEDINTDCKNIRIENH